MPYRPFTAVTRARIPSGTPGNALRDQAVAAQPGRQPQDLRSRSLASYDDAIDLYPPPSMATLALGDPRHFSAATADLSLSGIGELGPGSEGRSRHARVDRACVARERLDSVVHLGAETDRDRQPDNGRRSRSILNDLGSSFRHARDDSLVSRLAFRSTPSCLIWVAMNWPRCWWTCHCKGLRGSILEQISHDLAHV
jgi:hypothetical protein